jgi:hypothetical protein
MALIDGVVGRLSPGTIPEGWPWSTCEAVQPRVVFNQSLKDVTLLDLFMEFLLQGESCRPLI